MGNDKKKPEDKGPLSLSMVTLKRTGGEGPGITTCIADMLGVSPVNCSPAGHTFLHVARVKKHTAVREYHAFSVRFSHGRALPMLPTVM